MAKFGVFFDLCLLDERGYCKMPTYEYECKKCGYLFEKFQSIKDEPVKKCPKCKSAVRRLLGAGAGIIFKGSGFYETDYKKKSVPRTTEKKESESSSSASAKPAEKKSTSSSEKKI